MGARFLFPHDPAGHFPANYVALNESPDRLIEISHEETVQQTTSWQPRPDLGPDDFQAPVTIEEAIAAASSARRRNGALPALDFLRPAVMSCLRDAGTTVERAPVYSHNGEVDLGVQEYR